MTDSASKAIQYTFQTVAAILVGVLLSFVFDLLLPIGVVVVACSVWFGYMEVCNWRREMRCKQLQRQLKDCPERQV